MSSWRHLISALPFVPFRGFPHFPTELCRWIVFFSESQSRSDWIALPLNWTTHLPNPVEPESGVICKYRPLIDIKPAFWQMESRKHQQMEKGFCSLEAIYSSCWAGVPKGRKLLLGHCVLSLKIGEHSEVSASTEYQPQTGLSFSVIAGSLAGFSSTAFSPSEVLQRMRA